MRRIKETAGQEGEVREKGSKWKSCNMKKQEKGQIFFFGKKRKR